MGILNGESHHMLRISNGLNHHILRILNHLNGAVSPHGSPASTASMTWLYLKPHDIISVSHLTTCLSQISRRAAREPTMSKNTVGKNTEKDKNKKWEVAYTARMRQIVPGLFLGNVEASYKWEMLQKVESTHLSLLLMPGGCGGTLLQERQASQHIVTNGFRVQIRRRKTSLLIWAISATLSTRWHLPFFRRCPPWSSSTNTTRMMSHAEHLRRPY